MSFSFLPVVANDATLYGIFVAAHRANGVPLNANNFRQGPRQVGSVTGFYSNRLIDACRALNFGDSDAELRSAIMGHTLFGFYQKGRTEAFADRWLEELISGKSRQNVTMAPGQAAAPADGLRWCRACVEEDQGLGRPAVWRVLHQVPYLRHCCVHRERLLDRCDFCGVPVDLGHGRRLPGDACGGCGRQRFSGINVAKSPGYLAVTALAGKAIQGQLPWLRADVWFHLHRAATAKLEDAPSGWESVRATILKRWNVGSEADLLKQLRFKLSVGLDLANPGTGLVSPTLLERLLIADALIEMGLLRLDEMPIGPAAAADELEAALVTAALDRGLSPQIAVAILGNQPLPQIGAEFDISPSRLRLFLDELSAHTREEMKRQKRGPIPRSRVRSGDRIRPSLPTREKREQSRRLMEAVLKENPRVSRKKLRDLSHNVYSWLEANDRVWLESRLPRWGNEFRSGLIEKHRATISEFVRVNVGCTRTEVLRSCCGAYVSLIRNDRDWLFALLPSRRRY